MVALQGMDKVVAAAKREHRSVRKGLLVFVVTGFLGALIFPFLAMFTGGSFGVESPHAKYAFLLWPVQAIDQIVRLFVETKDWGIFWLLGIAFFGYGLLAWGLWMLGRFIWRRARGSSHS